MKKVLILVLIIFAVGCAKKYVKETEEPVRAKPEAAVEAPKEVKVEEKIIPRELAPTPAIQAQEPAFELKDALFDYDKYDIRPDARAALDSVAAWLNKNKNINVLIEGHCDERGTNEYNLALGEERANATKNYIITRGVAPTRINTISYGEEKPFCTEQNEDCYQKNRRAHFVAER